MSASSQIHPPRALTALSDARPAPRITEADVPLSRLQADMAQIVERQRLAQLDELRVRLPLNDPDRHALDVPADLAFARLVCDPIGGGR